MPDLDKLIGANLARARKDMPQQELAEKMRDRGFKWSQATVWAVEKGDRPLRLAEAWEISKLLGMSMDSLTRPAEQSALIRELDGWFGRMRAAWLDLRQLALHYEAERALAKDAAERLKSSFPSEWQDAETKSDADSMLAGLLDITAESAGAVVEEILSADRVAQDREAEWVRKSAPERLEGWLEVAEPRAVEDAPADKIRGEDRDGEYPEEA